jgi:hypothetical protein
MLAAHGARDVIAGIRQLAVVGHEHPAAVENLVQFVLEHVRLGVQRTVDAVRLDEVPVTGRGETLDTHAHAPA